MSTRNNTKSVSYRRNRDYSKHFTWTYELNADLYACYIKAKENPKIGYMARMKNYWDTTHPELDYFSSKQLRTQAINIENQRCLLNTASNEPPSTNNNLTETSMSIENQHNISDTVLLNEETSIDVNLPQINMQNAAADIHLSNHNNNNIVYDVLYTKYSTIFSRYFQTFENKTLHERKYDIPIYNFFNERDWIIINHVIYSFLNTFKTIDLWKVNVSQYAGALTMLEIHNKLPDPTSNRGKKNQIGFRLLKNELTAYEKRFLILHLSLNVVKITLH